MVRRECIYISKYVVPATHSSLCDLFARFLRWNFKNSRHRTLVRLLTFSHSALNSNKNLHKYILYIFHVGFHPNLKFLVTFKYSDIFLVYIAVLLGYGFQKYPDFPPYPQWFGPVLLFCDMSGPINPIVWQNCLKFLLLFLKG